MKLKRLNQMLNSLWKYLSSVEFRVILEINHLIETSRPLIFKNKKGSTFENADAALYLSSRIVHNDRRDLISLDSF
jgi:hypothetical protein